MLSLSFHTDGFSIRHTMLILDLSRISILSMRIRLREYNNIDVISGVLWVVLYLSKWWQMDGNEVRDVSISPF